MPHSLGSRPRSSAATSAEKATTTDPFFSLLVFSSLEVEDGVGATKEKAAPETWRMVLEVSGSAGSAEAKVERQRRACEKWKGGGG